MNSYSDLSKFTKFKSKDKNNKKTMNLLLDEILNYKIIIFALGFILISNIIIYQNSEAVNQTTDNTNNYPLSKLFDQVQQSIVQISSSDENTSQQLGFRLGSGFVYDEIGHIITNNHVISVYFSNII